MTRKPGERWEIHALYDHRHDHKYAQLYMNFIGITIFCSSLRKTDCIFKLCVCKHVYTQGVYVQGVYVRERLAHGVYVQGVYVRVLQR